MVKSRGKVTRSKIPQNVGGMAFVKLKQFQIAVWTPRPDGLPPYEQVHLLLEIENLRVPAVLRFKSPDTLGFIIEELARYRREVWPDAEPVSLQTKLKDQPDEEEPNEKKNQ